MFVIFSMIHYIFFILCMLFKSNSVNKDSKNLGFYILNLVDKDLIEICVNLMSSAHVHDKTMRCNLLSVL